MGFEGCGVGGRDPKSNISRFQISRVAWHLCTQNFFLWSMPVSLTEAFHLSCLGYMDGAVQAGERAAREVLFTMGKIAAEEIHQIEPPSQDVPPVPCQLTTFQSWLPTVPVFLTTMTATAALVGGLSLRHFSK